MTLKRLFTWLIPLLVVSMTMAFFLVIVRPEIVSSTQRAASAKVPIAIALIVLIAVGALAYHLAARRVETNRQPESK